MAGSARAEPFPFVISGYDAEPSATDFSHLSSAPAGAAGFVRALDGHFATDAGRLRIWGVNLCFGACFPDHADAERVAAHLAKLGINGVRFHHHETSPSPRGLFGPEGAMDPDQVDRLDYFLAQLHRHGIYANLNLHVGRNVSRQLGLPSLGTQHHLAGDKHALHFMPEVQTAFWEFCRAYLGHTNPYRRLRRADDPGIAMIEICNENKFSDAGPGAILAAPEPYRSALVKQWNVWLRARYGDTAALRSAWEPTARAKPRRLAESQQWSEEGLGGWRVSDHGGAAPIAATSRESESRTILRMEPRTTAVQAWHQQLASPPFAAGQGTSYLLQFEARADEDRSLYMNVATTIDGQWTPLGLTEDVALHTEWTPFQFVFVSPRDVAADARLAFDLGGDSAAVEFRGLALVEGGGAESFPPEQSLEAGSVGLPAYDWLERAHADFAAFMRDTETAFYQKTKQLLTEELGVRVPITTTQANYQPVSILAEVADYADMHAYWHHPIFPGRQWDPQQWTVQNETLTAFPFDNQWPRVNLMMRAGWRLHGKPFTFSEWNVGEPGFFSADAVPIAAVIASLQDWDAVFFFDYHSASDNWDPGRITGYFDINGQPAKTALLAAFANLYRRVDLPPLDAIFAAAPGQEAQLGALALRGRVGISPLLEAADAIPLPSEADLSAPEHKRFATPDNSVVWDARDPARAHVLIDTPRTRCVWGLVGGQRFQLGPWDFAFGPLQRDYAVVVATSRDDNPLETSASILLSAVANAENQQMGWNADRTSVGTDWGHGPTLVHGVPFTLTIPAAQTATRLFALDSQGIRTAHIPPTATDDDTIVYQLGPNWKTLFYELAAE